MDRPQALPERLVFGFGFFADLQAFFDECLRRPTCRADDPQALFDQAFGGQTVIVVAHRVKNALPVHAPEAGHEIGVAVGVDMSQV